VETIKDLKPAQGKKSNENSFIDSSTLYSAFTSINNLEPQNSFIQQF